MGRDGKIGGVNRVRMKAVHLADELFRGAVSLERTSTGVKPWRIPYGEFALFPPNGLNGRAEEAAGIRLAFVTASAAVEVVVGESDKQQAMDCVVNGELAATRRIEPEERILRFDGLGEAEKEIELFFDQRMPVVVQELRVNENASVRPFTGPRPKWVTYGSSISQCTGAASPAQTWPALVARRAKLDLTCLGYAGNCLLEPMVARLIRDLPADFISLCLGINVYGHDALSPRTFKAAVIAFIQIIREQHPTAPIAVISPICSPPRETTENRVAFTLVCMRAEIRAAVEMLRSRGDQRLRYVNGLDLLGEPDADYLPDHLHPNSEGYALMADRFQRLVVDGLWGDRR